MEELYNNKRNYLVYFVLDVVKSFFKIVPTNGLWHV